MKTEYRELNAVIKAIWSVKISPNAEIFNALKKAIEEEVKNIEPADVVEVVRCKDCRFSEKSGGYLSCGFFNIWNVKQEGFCFNGKRRTDDGK